MKTITRITINQNGNQILTCKVCKDINNILFMSNEGILELISGLNYMDNLPIVPDLEKPIEIQITYTREIPIEQNKRVQTKIKEIIYNNLYDTLVEELKDTISRFKAQYNIQEINPYISDILQNPEDPIYIPHQDTWTEHFPKPGSNKNDYTLYLSDPQAQYNKLLRTQQKLRNKKK